VSAARKRQAIGPHGNGVEGRKKLLVWEECEKLLVGKNDAPCHAGLVKPKRLKFETLFLPILKVSTLASY
jgi:hypothetical protein